MANYLPVFIDLEMIIKMLLIIMMIIKKVNLFINFLTTMTRMAILHYAAVMSHVTLEYKWFGNTLSVRKSSTN